MLSRKITQEFISREAATQCFPARNRTQHNYGKTSCELYAAPVLMVKLPKNKSSVLNGKAVCTAWFSTKLSILSCSIPSISVNTVEANHKGFSKYASLEHTYLLLVSSPSLQIFYSGLEAKSPKSLSVGNKEYSDTSQTSV